MPSAGFEIAIAAINLPQNNALYHTATGIRLIYVYNSRIEYRAVDVQVERIFDLRQRRLRAASRKGTPS